MPRYFRPLALAAAARVFLVLGRSSAAEGTDEGQGEQPGAGEGRCPDRGESHASVRPASFADHRSARSCAAVSSIRVATVHT